MKTWATALAVIVVLSGCAHLYLEDCGEDGQQVIGADQPRIRSWRVRMFLGDEPSAARRFATYAAMSAYAYVEDADCGHEAKVDTKSAAALSAVLTAERWERVKEAEVAGACEDATGLFYHVWKRDLDDRTDVVIAFRGTWGAKDWWYGNMYWFRRLFTENHQYARSKDYARHVMQYFEGAPRKDRTVRFYTAGHSLGGGLAQGVLYEFPHKVVQAYAFAPSSATGYVDRTDKSALPACDCNVPSGEARIYRVYESYEILANLRIFHKMILPPEPYINEIRFPYKSSLNPIGQHSMADLALALAEKQGSASAAGTKPWYSGVTDVCTERFAESQKTACEAGGAKELICPAR